MLIMLGKGICIGLLFGVPAGAVGSMTIQRTLTKGYQAGLLTGLGSSAADCLYAAVGICGLTLISDFLLKHQAIINLFGGCLILTMGIKMLRHQTDAANPQPGDRAADGLKMFLSSFTVGITNPAAIMTFLFAFSWFGISGSRNLGACLALIWGVFLGTYCWWGILTAVTEVMKRKRKLENCGWLNHIFGFLMIAFTVVIFIRLFVS